MIQIIGICEAEIQPFDHYFSLNGLLFVFQS